jgi:4-aminobutyrate aminotransferase/(S)-3-amino-2-methylpropionate transaminase
MDDDHSTLRKMWEEHMSKAVKVYFPHFLAEGEGARVKDVRGREFIDLTSGIGVLNLGHRPAGVLKALKDQLERYLHTCFTVQMYEPALLLAKRIAAIAPEGLTKSAFFNSGAEAVENAVKLSRARTGRRAVIAFENSFHGRTFMAMTLTGKVRPYKAVFGPLFPDVYHLPYPYPYRYPGDPSDAAAVCLDALRRFFRTHVPAEDVAAVVAEPIQGEGGFIVPPDDFLPGLREICDEEGIILVDDEVQAGLGRTGRWFAIEHFGVRPDLIITGKALGGGLPLSAVTGPADILDHPPVGSIGGTFGGNPLSCVAGLATLEGVEKVLPRVGEIERRMMTRFGEWLEDFEHVGEARGKGAMMAIELVKDRRSKEPAEKEAHAVQDECYKRGLLILTAGLYNNVVRFHPPLNIPMEDLERALDLVEESLRAVLRS